MAMITRLLENILLQKLYKGKVVVLMGARQTGKTTLLRHLVAQQGAYLWLNGEEYSIQQRFKQPDAKLLKALLGNHRLVVIDEAQKIENIGLALKILVDTYPEIQIIATGSSSFDLANKTNEPLTGRKFEYQLYPISTQELCNHQGPLAESTLLKHRLVYGYYPEIVTHLGEEEDLLKLLADSYLYKDVLMLDNIKKPEKLVSLLQALAFQMGNEVSYNELSNLIGIDGKTIESYIALLEKAFIIFRLHSFSRNLRNELKMSKKIYFYDNGIRNAILSNFQLLEGRQDIGALWENYLVSERKKYNHYRSYHCNTYFWRTQQGQEIDYIEERNGKLHAFEFKWNAKKVHRPTKTFSNNYPESTVEVITPNNYLPFVAGVDF
jgi:predicted AAA+ superfamily ATPase